MCCRAEPRQPKEHSGSPSSDTKPHSRVTTAEFVESEFRIAVWFRWELHIGSRTQRTNAFDWPNSAYGNLAWWTDIDPVRNAVKR